MTANFGAGESVVADLTTPDTWVVHRCLVTDREIATKTPMVDVLGNAVDVPIGVASQPSLSESQVLYLAQIAKKIEAHYRGVLQDIEWAISKDGYFRILQDGPLRRLKTRCKEAIVLSIVLQQFAGMTG